MANNGGRQGGGGGAGAGNGNMNEHIEFTVKAEEDLYLEGIENTIRRVTAETNYSCLMLKTQRFSSLFRHYAKYHGLRKDDLEYYFVNPLENEDTPESVQLQRGDTIMVRKRRKPEPPEPAADDSEFLKDLKELLNEEDHMDTIFKVRELKGEKGEKKLSSDETSLKDAGMTCSDNSIEIEIRAHKCILSARSEYFRNMFSKSHAFFESKTSTINVDPWFNATTIRRMLEFLYCNSVDKLGDASSDEILNLLHLSDQWQLRDLKRLCEYELIKSHMDVENVAKMYCSSSEYNAKRLSEACISFIMDNIKEVTGNTSFQEEMNNYPSLCIPILKAAADLVPMPVYKKQRTEGVGAVGGAGSSVGGCSSSPVPDSDS